MPANDSSAYKLEANTPSHTTTDAITNTTAELHVRTDWTRVADRCSAFMREEALLLDTPKLMSALAAIIAYRGPVDQAIEELEAPVFRDVMSEASELANLEDEKQLEAGFHGLPLSSDRARILSLDLGVHPDRARRVCVLFNGLPPNRRRILFALMLERIEPVKAVERGLAPSLSILKRHFRQAMQTLHGALACGESAPNLDLGALGGGRAGSS
ncbi:MAG: hypothetical protein ACI835_002664 [Planctomycetota bacterium]|jgi:hypothetical protein